LDIELTPHEARVIGCLLEKEITTPDQYPLSLNALTSACNQKSNRDPVLHLAENEVQDVIDQLRKKHLIMERSGFGSRVPKYQHRFCNTEFGHLRFSPQELGIVCALLLRGPQTPGELRAHTQRLCRFADVHEAESTLEQLAERDDGPFVVRLPREAGRRESRYAHLFGGQIDIEAFAPEPATAAAGAASQSERLSGLEELVRELRAELEEVKQKLDRLDSGSD
jgi:uncharacterized protein YceH (UPF0502 family)